MGKTFAHTGQPVPFLSNNEDLLLDHVVATDLESPRRE